MFKEYFGFEFKNFHRQIHYPLVIALTCLGLIFISFGSLLGWNHSLTLKIKIGLWILIIIYNSVGTFSLVKKSLFFLQRIIYSPTEVYTVKLLVSWITALESIIILLITQIITNFFSHKLIGSELNWSQFIKWSYLLLLIPIINGICFTFDLKIKSYWISMILSCAFCEIIYGIICFQKWWDLFFSFKRPTLNLAILLSGIIIILFNALPIMNHNFFKRLNYENYPN